SAAPAAKTVPAHASTGILGVSTVTFLLPRLLVVLIVLGLIPILYGLTNSLWRLAFTANYRDRFQSQYEAFKEDRPSRSTEEWLTRRWSKAERELRSSGQEFDNRPDFLNTTPSAQEVTMLSEALTQHLGWLEDRRNRFAL